MDDCRYDESAAPSRSFSEDAGIAVDGPSISFHRFLKDMPKKDGGSGVPLIPLDVRFGLQYVALEGRPESRLQIQPNSPSFPSSFSPHRHCIKSNNYCPNNLRII